MLYVLVQVIEQKITIKLLKALYAEEVVGKNELLEQILSVMEPLVSYGFFWQPDEIRSIIETLLDIMDGKSDRPAIGMRIPVLVL